MFSDEFWFISRRVSGQPWSVIIYINGRRHLRLSNCCEARRVVGARLGQGAFTLLSVEAAQPCLRCIMERDPIARRQAAKVAKYRGQYDQYGNRLTRTMINTQNLLANNDIFNEMDSKYQEEVQDEEDESENKQLDPADYNFGNFVK